MLQDLLGRQLSFVRRNAPAWIREQSSDPADDDDNAPVTRCTSPSRRTATTV